MADPLDLTGDIAAAIDGAALRGSTLVMGHVGADGNAVLSFRGSAQVLGPQELGIWVRKRDDGFVPLIAANPTVSFLYYDAEGPGPKYLSLRGRARVDESANDAVYAGQIEAERAQDPERKGVAVIVDVDSVQGFGPDGGFQLER